MAMSKLEMVGIWEEEVEAIHMVVNVPVLEVILMAIQGGTVVVIASVGEDKPLVQPFVLPQQVHLSHPSLA